MKLIIQIPAYNEEATLPQTIRDLPKKIEGIESIEILVIDDGSTDGTSAVAKRAGVQHVLRLHHRGLSTAFVAGIDMALRLGADIIVNTDADHQYRGSDVARLIEPILRRGIDVVIGDRDVRQSPHMGPLKKLLQRFGSWAVGLAAGVTVPDVTSGFRAFSREAALKINVFNPFTYTLETIIQAGHRNLTVESVTIGTNPPTRPSRLYRGMGSYVRKSMVTIFRMYALYRPLKTFFFMGTLLFVAGVILGTRFLFYFVTESSDGHIQSLILAAIFLIVGFLTMLIGLLADLISVNRRLHEEILIRMKRVELAAVTRRRPTTRDRGFDRKGSGKRVDEEPEQPAETQWVWLTDEAKIPSPTIQPIPAISPQRAANDSGGPRRRRRRRRPGGVRRFAEPIEHHGHHDANPPTDERDES